MLPTQDWTKSYYYKVCSATEQDGCKQLAADLKDYGEKKFAQQVHDYNKPQKPIGIGFIKRKPVEYLNLGSVPSLLTQADLAARQTLLAYTKESAYYLQNLNTIQNSYPVVLEGDTQKELLKLKLKVWGNKLALKGSRPEEGAMACYNLLNTTNCTHVLKAMNQKIYNVTESDLFLFQSMK